MKLWLLLGVLIVVGVGVYHVFKPLPAGLSFAGPRHPLVAPKLLTDVTYRDSHGDLHLDHTIFDEVFRLIGQAEQLVVVDMFLFNDSKPDDRYRPLADQLTTLLIERHRRVDGLRVIVITDPLNTLYGGTPSPYLERLRAEGIPVVETALTPLRDSNPLWSAGWRVCCEWLGNSADAGWLPNLLDGGKVTLRSYLALPNFKANHRKTLIVDEGAQLRGLITSANPHDGSARHGNIALSFSGPAVTDLLRTEQAVLALSDINFPVPPFSMPDRVEQDADATTARIVTESKILSTALAMIRTANPGDRLDLAMFYLSHRDLVEAFVEARRRGVTIRILLDPNNEAFGHAKSGIPNRQVAMEFHQAGIPVRWCNTQGEQCHSKLLVRQDTDGQWQLLLGSANFTRRNLNDLNLETDVHVQGTESTALLGDIEAYFDRLWQQGPDQSPTLSLPYEAYADPSHWRYWRYRVMEATGLSTF